ncbi:hypothetical protein SKAU_G00349020 [Synaphobranchus kaupii]|uniref:Uncharacterized protein n=1 Tax=Synaphobranchus kaupii TaxID=118154 RepID=A0A9Q1EK65_SYNKA|nr:hypothetical protein SKAU_G00349020 [Synaphobranchus kaupii]
MIYHGCHNATEDRQLGGDGKGSGDVGVAAEQKRAPKPDSTIKHLSAALIRRGTASFRVPTSPDTVCEARQTRRPFSCPAVRVRIGHGC